MKVIALSGWKESGKDMCADYLVEKYGFKRLAFADPLKKMVAEQYDIPLNYMYDRDLKEKAIENLPVSPKDAFSRQVDGILAKEFRCLSGFQYDDFLLCDKTQALYGRDGKGQHQLYWTPRALCILEGSIKRSVSPNYWVSRAINKADRDSLYVISDLRYCNEANTLEKLKEEGKIDGLLLVRIDRWEFSPSDDPSERDLDMYDFKFRINNLYTENTTKQQACEQVDKLVRTILL